MRYDPDRAPAADWLDLDEDERILAVEAYHESIGTDLPNATLHAVIHVTVENQIAMELDPVVRALRRLRRQGLSRHEAIHAIGAVLAEYLHGRLKGPRDETAADVHDGYYEDLGSLTAEAWRARG